MDIFSNLEIHAVDRSRWPDFETLFESRGRPKNCWCMVWRAVGEETKHADKSHRKTFIRKRVETHTPIGFLAYLNGQPIAWCSIAPRETYRPLGGDESKEKVWSLACFFVKREFKNQGLSGRLVNEALNYARDNGAHYVEAYPVDPGSPSYRFMGYVHTFEKCSFTFVKKTGKRRNVMIKKLY